MTKLLSKLGGYYSLRRTAEACRVYDDSEISGERIGIVEEDEG